MIKEALLLVSAAVGVLIGVGDARASAGDSYESVVAGCTGTCDDGCQNDLDVNTDGGRIEFGEPTLTAGDCDPKQYPDTGSDCIVENHCPLQGTLSVTNTTGATMRYKEVNNGQASGWKPLSAYGSVTVSTWDPGSSITCGGQEGNYGVSSFEFQNAGQWVAVNARYIMKCSKCNVTAPPQ
jgi:hypothetical protein